MDLLSKADHAGLGLRVCEGLSSSRWGPVPILKPWGPSPCGLRQSFGGPHTRTRPLPSFLRTCPWSRHGDPWLETNPTSSSSLALKGPSHPGETSDRR